MDRDGMTTVELMSSADTPVKALGRLTQLQQLYLDGELDICQHGLDELTDYVVDICQKHGYAITIEEVEL